MVQLPGELWGLICHEAIIQSASSYEKFDLDTAVALSGTNRLFRRTAIPWVYRDIRVDTEEELHNFFLLLRDIPQHGRLVKSFALNSQAWVLSGNDRGSADYDLDEELLRIGAVIGAGLDSFHYLVGWEPFNETSEFDCLLHFFRHTRSIIVAFICTSPDKHFRLLHVLLASAENVEEFVLRQYDGNEIEPAYFFRPKPLPSTLKRLEITRMLKPESPRPTRCFSVWISRLHALEELHIPCIAYGEPCLNDLIRSFRVAGVNLRELDIGSFGVPLPGNTGCEEWERDIFTILGLCPRLIKLRLRSIIHARPQLFDSLPESLEDFRYEFTIDSTSSEAVAAGPGDEESFIVAFKIFVEKRKSTLKKVWISHGLEGVSKDTNLVVIDFVKKCGIAEVAFGFYGR